MTTHYYNIKNRMYKKIHILIWFNRYHYIYLWLSSGTVLGKMARKSENGLTDSREEVLTLLRNVAKSPTKESFEKNLSSLKESAVWLANPKLRNWFEKTWFVESKVRIETKHTAHSFILVCNRLLPVTPNLEDKTMVVLSSERKNLFKCKAILLFCPPNWE